MSAREEILAAIRSRVSRETPDVEALDEALRPRLQTDLVTWLKAKAEAIDATVEEVDHAARVPAAIAELLALRGEPPELSVGDDPAWDELPWQESGLVLRSSPRETGVVGLSRAAYAVAETGTVVMASGPGHPATLNFLPDLHIVYVPQSRVVAYQEDVWSSLREHMPRSLAFITGPSRTGDIELKLQHGAHGPRSLHLLIVNDR